MIDVWDMRGVKKKISRHLSDKNRIAINWRKGEPKAVKFR